MTGVQTCALPISGVIWQMVLERCPEKTFLQERALYLIGICYQAQEDYPQAIDYYTKVAEGYSADFFVQRASYYLGTLYQKLGNYSKATEWFGRQCQMYPGELSAEKALLRWGKIDLYDVKDYWSAADVFVEYLAKYNNPDNRRIPEVLNALVLCYEKTGKGQQAAVISGRLQEGYPDSVFVQSIVDEYEN